MAKNAYLIVSDLHISYKSLANRINYRNEIDYVQSELIQVAKKYRNYGYTVKLLLLGDVFHNSYQSVFNALIDSDFFKMWKQVFGDIYSVLGNHELSYYDSNPFYSLVTEVESKKVKDIPGKICTPIGVLPVISVPDTLCDGNVIFYFNHYACPIAKVEDTNKINIGLFHQEIVDHSIKAKMETTLGSGIFANTVSIDSSGILNDYDYCFFGHMHKIYGMWQTDSNTVLCYLASLGRTNETEVNDNFLERNIPVILVDDGNFIAAEDNKFLLMPRSECVNTALVEKAKKTYEIEKMRKAAKTYVPIGDDPLKNLRQVFQECPKHLDVLNAFISAVDDPIYLDLNRRISYERI